ncbi:MAG: DUF547 domain-containing protein [Rhizobiaceae bacterium]
MRLKHFATITFAALVTIPLTAGSTFAQSAIEKSLVAKSRLHARIWTRHDSDSSIEVNHGAWNAFLKKYVGPDNRGINLVAYSRVSNSDKASLKNYLEALQSTDVTKLNRNEQYAFWINLYNASTVNIGIDNYPVKSILNVKSSILDLKGPFNDPVATVNGKTLTLDDIESGIVRPIWKDPRLHYAFNCAAVSCPNLGSEAYLGKNINAQLDAAAASYVNDTRGVRIEGDKITASKIYFWYDVDFGGNEVGILSHIRKYAKPGLKSALDGKTGIAKYEYDWALNDRR